jgi:hypothetical protein
MTRDSRADDAPIVHKASDDDSCQWPFHLSMGAIIDGFAPETNQVN